MVNDSSTRIVAALGEWIAQAPPGARLPSTRSLVAEYAASPVTVQKALRTLTAQGLIESRPGVGTFVRAVRTARPLDYGWQTAALRSPPSRLPSLSTPMRRASNDVIALHAGYPDRELLPERLIRSALTRAARSDAALSPSPAAGLPELQSWFAHELGSATPVGVTPPTASDVIVLPGSQSGLSSVFRALVPFGQPLLMESPTYWGAILAAAQAGVHVVPVPSGPDGPDPDELARAFEETGARVFYAQPNYANPTGAQWSNTLAENILEVVRANGAFLVEDDWAHDFGIDTNSNPVAAHDDAGHVVYLRSLTKSVSPSIRIAAVIARGPARERILADRGASSMYVSGLLQAAALDVVTQPGWQTHLRNLRQQLRARRDLLVTGLREHVPRAHLTNVPKGGLNLWVRLPDATNLTQLVRDCEAAGVLIAPGVEWFPAEPAGPFIRLNYSGTNPGAFPEGLRVIGDKLAAPPPVRG
ncbi:transcriptional regulator [Rhodococcus opacus PD630]|uniref:aminotransferase-like domain-containing protein n=1 Tax=Rhodococcus opacus TaxID=37919 RepID=UPI00029CB6AF|nr:PLP-dependent aminotransferase family protein [Rhodococcus opacus]AHK35030.1 putative HTH-type transcriptional regulator ydfD [Rhodococcus opacus PD630]EHI41691.1 transcriptional regulator [Rhodococcus opacus PD630]UDG97089.1 PLP-dependent aminotransferase family protein [Rhodococcus opacus PD630]